MTKVCFYFQVHQPYRLSDLRLTEIESMLPSQYFDTEKNRAIFRKVAEKCYLPANATMLRMLKNNPKFRVSYSLSGVFLDQCRDWGDDVLQSFKDLAATGQVEFLGETYYHSLSVLFSLNEFCEQVKCHSSTIRKLFGKTPTVFRNTELVYSNEIAEVVRQLGFKGILAEGADRVLQGRSPNVLYAPPSFDLPESWRKTIAAHRVHRKPVQVIKALLKNYRLSDDIAFRFSAAHASGTPLFAETFADWVNAAGGESVNLFMDYETFGEHQWADTGIFNFLEALPHEFAIRGIATHTPSQALKDISSKGLPQLDAHHPVSWADTERDLSAWRGNHLQESALATVYSLESAVRSQNDPELLDIWRKLQTSDHFYYLCTKYWSDGDVHKYFSPYESPYEAFRRFSHAMEGLRMTLEKLPCVLKSGKKKLIEQNVLSAASKAVRGQRSAVRKHPKKKNRHSTIRG